MKNTFLLAISISILITISTSAKDTERKQSFDYDWQFSQDSIEWRAITIPHDWSIEGQFDKDAQSGNDGGYLATGKGWYSKTFTLGKESEDKVLRLYFEGVYMNAIVYVNGKQAGGHPYGYSSFFVNITPFVHSGINQITVSVDNSNQKNCRWYSGSGIYRHVWLLTTESIFLDEWGLYIHSNPKEKFWEMEMEAPFKGDIQNGDKVTWHHSLYDSEGRLVASTEGANINQTMQISNPKLWSPKTPELYTLKTQLLLNGRIVDELTNTTGFRTIQYDSNEGLSLNGQQILLNGGCLHHDNGILGAAAFDKAEYRKAELMKAAGFNAVRTSHNVPSEAFLHACDKIGLLVIDEAFDGWRDKKTDYDYSTLIDRWWQDDLAAMVCRDRNHPSIFCWSIGNEVIERKKLEVVKTAHNMANLCHLLDPTRPVTSALASWDNDWDIYDPLAAEHDIVGYNYMIHKAEEDHQRVPNRVMIQTESYPRDAWQNYCTSKDHSYIIGDFVWTALDYIGESGIGRWYYEGEVAGEHFERPLFPWHAAYCGDIDLIGQRKPISHYRSMLWNTDGEQIYMAVREPDGYNGKIKETLWGTWPTFESWNWPGHEGKPIEVEVYSRYPSISLFLNGELVGHKENSAENGYKTTFSLPYQPGELRAEGTLNNKSQKKDSVILQTAGKVKTIRLTSDRKSLSADGQDLAFITVELLDGQNILNPTADNNITVEVKGAGTLAAFGNADIKDTTPYTQSTHKTWKGRALLVIKSKKKAGTIKIKASGEGLSTTEISIPSRK